MLTSPGVAQLFRFSSCKGPIIATQNNDDPGAVAKGWRVLKFASLGIEMAVATFIGWGLGYWLDLQLGTGPWLMLFFLLCGVAAGFKGVFRAAVEAEHMMEAERTDKDSEPRPGVDEASDGRGESK